MATIVEETSSSSDQTLVQLSKYFETRPGLYKTQHIQEIYEYVKRQEHGDELIDLVIKMSKKFGPRQAEVASPITLLAVGAGPFSQSKHAQSSSINLLFYTRIYVDWTGSDGRARQAVTNAGGICLALPGGASWGDLYYNNEADLHGNDVTTQTGGYLGYWQITYWRDNNCFATFQSGGIPSGACAMGGNTDFN